MRVWKSLVGLLVVLVTISSMAGAAVATEMKPIIATKKVAIAQRCKHCKG